MVCDVQLCVYCISQSSGLPEDGFGPLHCEDKFVRGVDSKVIYVVVVLTDGACMSCYLSLSGLGT